MKLNLFKRGAALALTMVLGVGLFPPAAAASAALGDDVHTATVGVAPGTMLERNIFWSNTYSDLRNERYLTYQPTAGVRPVVVYGDKVLSKKTLDAMARDLEARGLRVVGGLNGDFFDMGTGNTLGVLISDSVLRSTAGGFQAVGFREDGSAFIGSPDITVTATFLGQTLRVTNVNKTRTALGDKTPGGYYLYTEDYAKTTQHTSPGIDVIITPTTDNLGNQVDVDLEVADGENAPPVNNTGATQPGGTRPPEESTPPLEGADAPPQGIPTGIDDSGDLRSASFAVAEDAPEEITGTLTRTSQLTVGGRVSGTVDQVLQSTGSIDIPAGKMVLTINNTNNEWLVSQLGALKPGDTVDIDVTAQDPRWDEAVTALGGFYRIVTGGQVGPHTDKNANPRTAVGIRADGTVVLYAIDGKQPGYSVGATLEQVAQRMIELGCVDAVGLDGGGSTTMGATLPTGTAMEVVNKPSEGKLRAVSTGLFLVSDLKPTGTLDHFYVAPYDAMLLSGARLPLIATAMDSAYYPTLYSGGTSWSIQNGDGTISAEGVFTAGGDQGRTVVTVSGGGVTGSAGITVVRTPDTIRLSLEGGTAPLSALALEPNQTLKLAATSVYKKLPLLAQNSCYTWTLDPAVGTVDENGVITAGPKSAIGSLVVSAGGTAVTIPVSVAGHIKELEGFESGIGGFTGTDTVTVEPEVSADQVYAGQGSLKLTYDATVAGTATAAASYAIPAGERYLGLWVYGDGSGNTLTAGVVDVNGQSTDVVLTALDFTGWKQIMAELPENAASLRSLNFIFGGGKQSVGTIWLDQLTTSNENFSDPVAPTVTVAVTGDTVTATVVDNLDKKFAETAITLKLDGVDLPFTWNADKSTLSAALPAADGKLHRVTVTAVDQSGNLGRGSADRLPAGTGGAITGPFADVTTHWAAPYTTYLYDQGIVSGAADGSSLFRPDDNITRGEFALMVTRWMHLDPEAYATVELPFADLAAIPDWALNGVKAMYAEGIIKGSLENGVLVSRAEATLSRAEAMTIFGRIQSKGYVAKALDFTDKDTVPAWSVRYVQSLVGQGVISGFEGMLRPLDPVKRAEVAKMLYTLR